MVGKSSTGIAHLTTRQVGRGSTALATLQNGSLLQNGSFGAVFNIELLGGWVSTHLKNMRKSKLGIFPPKKWT